MNEMTHIAQVPGMFTISVDKINGIIFVAVTGFWTLDVLKLFQKEMQSVVAQWRAERGAASIVIDISEAPVQSTEVVSYIQGQNSFAGPKDGLAIIVTSALLKMQLGRTDISIGNVAYVSSRDEAVAWLSTIG